MAQGDERALRRDSDRKQRYFGIGIMSNGSGAGAKPLCFHFALKFMAVKKS
ncbi:hypothetical protein J5J86_09360 [Aquabacter sp. L1I39]|uniref:hypothetical protein n=1 Tax=Aquabacter sp. L1I39 TaxID=2820278 RepID=UPI001AD9CB17|nr:hypothetical protein [Aquabacter sp. L1I39]QTL05463.1 hypothetical protein J5J86_09360 [Aquabacter sp. L1I39]